jgi:hypothetical protein
MWSALSDKRTGLPFTIADGPRQCNHSRVRVPWDTRPYFTVSDTRLPLSPPTTHRATVYKPCRDSTLVPPEYKSGAVTLHQPTLRGRYVIVFYATPFRGKRERSAGGRSIRASGTPLYVIFLQVDQLRSLVKEERFSIPFMKYFWHVRN